MSAPGRAPPMPALSGFYHGDSRYSILGWRDARLSVLTR